MMMCCTHCCHYVHLLENFMTWHVLHTPGLLGQMFSCVFFAVRCLIHWHNRLMLQPVVLTAASDSTRALQTLGVSEALCFRIVRA